MTLAVVSFVLTTLKSVVFVWRLFVFMFAKVKEKQMSPASCLDRGRNQGCH